MDDWSLDWPCKATAGEMQEFKAMTWATLSRPYKLYQETAVLWQRTITMFHTNVMVYWSKAGSPTANAEHRQPVPVAFWHAYEPIHLAKKIDENCLYHPVFQFLIGCIISCPYHAPCELLFIDSYVQLHHVTSSWQATPWYGGWLILRTWSRQVFLNRSVRIHRTW